MWQYLSRFLYAPNLPWHAHHLIFPRTDIYGHRIEGYCQRRRVNHVWQYRPNTPSESSSRNDSAEL